MLVAVYPERPSTALTTALLDGGFRPVPVTDAADVGERAQEHGWVGMVIELGTDAVPGLAIARRVRESFDVPALVVAGRQQLADLRAAECDDFVLTPIDGTELAIRLHRIGAGSENGSDADEVVTFKDLELNLATYQATLGSSYASPD